MQHVIKQHDTATASAIAAYRGETTICKPGKPRAPAKPRDSRSDTAANNRALHSAMRHAGLPGLRRDY